MSNRNAQYHYSYGSCQTLADHGYVVDIVSSPNEALLTFVTSSGEVFGVDITNAEKKSEQASIGECIFHISLYLCVDVLCFFVFFFHHKL